MVDRRNLITALAGSIPVAGIGLGLNYSANMEESREANSLDSVTTSSQDSRVTFDADIMRSDITSERTAAIEFKVGWAGSHQQILEFGSGLPFDIPLQSNPSQQIQLLPASAEISQKKNGTWLPNEDDISKLLAELPHHVASLKTNESVEKSWEIWAGPRTEMISAGKYSFSHDVLLDSDKGLDPVRLSLEIELR